MGGTVGLLRPQKERPTLVGRDVLPFESSDAATRRYVSL